MARFGALLLLAGGSLLTTAGCSRVKSNVVIVVIDTLRQDHLATYGYRRDPAPFLSGLAREGAVFDGLSPSSWTKPATASLLTGLHPVRHQAINRRDRLPETAVTLAELLRRSGYRTFGASANGWISQEFGFTQGFDSFVLLEQSPGADLNREVLRRIGQTGAPFFLYVHYIDPHAPYDPAAAWDGGALPASLRARGPVKVEDLAAPHFLQRPRELLARARDLYDGEIREADNALRQLVRGLAQRGLMDNTVLVVTSDHGEEFQEHGRMSHGQTLYEEVLRVPLVFHAPHLVRSGRRLGRASLIDVVPTLAALLGMESALEGQESLDGESFADQLEARFSKSRADRAFLSHLDFIDGAALALTRGDEKLVLSKNPYRKELFNLRLRPRERANLVGRRDTAAAFSRMAKEISTLYNGYARARLEPAAAKVDANLTLRLAALGYISSSQARQTRVIPDRIAPPGPTPGGRLGWEPGSRLGSCISVEAPGAESHLLAGWYAAGPNGRWAGRRATLALAPLPETSQTRLTMSGNNYRPTPVKLRVKVAHRPVLKTEVMPGPFQFSARVGNLRVQQPVLVEMDADSAFVPSHHGSKDSRSLGLFWSSICFREAVSGQPPPASSGSGSSGNAASAK